MSGSSSRGRRVAATVAKVVLPIALLAGSAQVAKTLIENRPEPERQEQVDRGLLVEVIEVEQAPHRLDVRAEGTVVAARQVVLAPQVTGRVTWVADTLDAGGLVAEDQDLLRIEDRDYRLNVDMRRAELERAEAARELEQGRQVVAQREWDMFAEDVPDDAAGRALALREPQLHDAEQAIEMAETRLAQARLDLGRTTLTAPFNAYVEEESVEEGQLVAPTSRIATLVGTDAFWVQVSVPVDRLAYVDIPGVNASEGSLVTVWQDLGRERVERDGRVIRLLPSLDPVGRMARVLVEVADPLRLSHPPAERGVPLLIGSFVHVDIVGNRTEPLLELPRVALREGDRAYVMTAEHALEIRDVDVAWSLPDSVLVASGLSDGESVVTSRVGTAVPGMRLRTPSDEVTEDDATAQGPAEEGGDDEQRAE